MVQCLVNYENCDKVEVLQNSSQELEPMPKRRRGAVKRYRKRSRKSVFARRTKVRVVRGRVGVKVAGFSNLQYVPASQIVRLIPVSRLRVAAKRILGKPPKSKRRVRRANRRRTKTRRARN